MNELRAMVEAYNRWRMGVPLVLATVVNVHGSAYRRPGARLLIAPSGAVGGLRAGCLEPARAAPGERSGSTGRKPWP
jgi:xanthine/CO dehydrogenase XdhC/CoxF family maturation factor